MGTPVKLNANWLPLSLNVPAVGSNVKGPEDFKTRLRPVARFVSVTVNLPVTNTPPLPRKCVFSLEPPTARTGNGHVSVSTMSYGPISGVAAGA